VNQKNISQLIFFILFVLPYCISTSYAGEAQVVTGTTRLCGNLSCNSIEGYTLGINVNTQTATSLNTGGSSSTSVGNATGTTTLDGNGVTVQSVTSAATAPAMIISGQNGAVAPNTTVGPYPQVPSGTGVLITGAGNNGPDVYIASQDGKAAISVTNTGVQIISPSGTGTGGGTIDVNSTNNYGVAGQYNTGAVTNNFGTGGSGTGDGSPDGKTQVTNNNIGNGGGAFSQVNNTFGAGSTSNTGLVSNSIGTSVNGGGAVTNSMGGGTGSSTNSVGAVTGGGSSTNNFGTTGFNGNSGTATNNIGTGYGASTNNFGNTNLSTTNSMSAGNSSSFMGNGVSTTSVQSGGGVGNSILGGTTSANSGTVLRGATGTYATVNANGKIEMTTGSPAESTTAMTLTNGLGNVHGMVVTERQATMSGGINSSSMTLNDYGATFSNSATGRPIQVHGVADGTTNFDAVNLQQLNAVKLGIAGVAAMNNIPALPADKNFNIGVGVGGFDSKQSFALGANARITENLVIKASASHGINANDSNVNTTTWGLGGALSW